MIDFSFVLATYKEAQLINTNKIHVSVNQTFSNFRSKKDAIKASLLEVGLLTPLVVRTSKDTVDAYELLAGSTRLECMREEGVEEVPCIVAALDDDEVVSTITDFNIHRESMLPMSMAKTIKQRSKSVSIESKKDQIEYLSTLFNMKPATVYNYMSLVNLPECLHAFVDNKRIRLKCAIKVLNWPENVQQALGSVLNTEPIKIGKTEVEKVETALHEMSAEEVEEKLLEIIMAEEDEDAVIIRGPIYKNFKSYFPNIDKEEDIITEIKSILEMRT